MTVVQYTQLDSTGNRNKFHWISLILFVGDVKKISIMPVGCLSWVVALRVRYFTTDFR